jgi:hypothetical protein
MFGLIHDDSCMDVVSDRCAPSYADVDALMAPELCSPRSRSQERTLTWLKDQLLDLGCSSFADNRSMSIIDDCFQTSLPPLDNVCASIVRENISSSILAGVPFRDILRNICALRTEYVMKVARPILAKLMSHQRNLNVFNQPVDPVALGIPSYLEVIREPMDLGTVLSRLRGGHYRTVKAAFQDMELVFTNATLFNPKTHNVYKMAKDMQAEFEGEVKQAEDKCAKDVSALL